MKLLEIRKRLKSRKPTFRRHDAHKRKELPKTWRRPRGIHNKVRHKFKSHLKMPSPGYRSPAEVRGMDEEGKMPLLVSTPSQLAAIDSKKHSVIVRADVGMRKKAEIVKLCTEKKIVMLNIAPDFLETVEKAIKERKELALARKKSKEARAEEHKKTKKSIEEKVTSEEKKEQENKEEEKLLTKRETS